MQVTINGRPREVPEDLTVQTWLLISGLPEGPVAVEINQEIVTRARHHEHRVLAGDVIEIVHFVGGG